MIVIATISGNGARPSIFGSTIDKSRTFHPTLGQASTGDWYSRGQAALAKFDDLRTRIASVANDGERAKILAWIGDPSKFGTPGYRYLAVQADAGAAQRAGTADNYSNPNVTDRVAALEDSVNQLDSMVTNAETAYGKLSQPVASTPAAVQAPKPDWTTPALIGVGIIVAGVVIAKLTKGGKR